MLLSKTRIFPRLNPIESGKRFEHEDGEIDQAEYVLIP